MNTSSEDPDDAKVAGVLVYGLICAWFFFAVTMAAFGQYVGSPSKPPLAFGLTIAAPILFFVIAYRRRGGIWRVAQKLDLRLIVLVHAWRIVAINFILAGADGRLPLGFAMPAGLGDIITGLAAIPLVWGMSRGVASIEKRFVAWNIFGLLDLVTAVALGILHSRSTLGILAGSGPTTLLMTELPRSLVPTFLVPMFILLHLLALSRRAELAAVSSERPRGTLALCGMFRAVAGR